LNTGDLGLKNEVGLVSITVGGENKFGWNITTDGLDVSVNNLKNSLRGAQRLKIYKENYSEGDILNKKLYLAGNLLRYAESSIGDSKTSVLASALELGKIDNFDFYTGGIGMFTSGFGYSGLNNRVLTWDMSSAAKYTSYLAYASQNRFQNLYVEGMEARKQMIETPELARLNAVESKMLLNVTLNTSEKMLFNRLTSIDYALNIWRGLGKTFKVQDIEITGYSDLLQPDKNSLIFAEDQKIFIDSFNLAGMLNELESKDKEEILAIASLYKGALQAKGTQLVEELIDRGIMSEGYSDLTREIATGKFLVKDIYDMVKPTDIVKYDFGTYGNADGYVLISRLTNRSLINNDLILTQRYGIEKDIDGKKVINGDSYIFNRNEDLFEEKLKEFYTFIDKIKQGAILRNVLEDPYIKLQISLRKETDWVTKSYLGEEYERYNSTKCKPYCNIVTANMLNYLGYERYIGDIFKGVARLTRNPENGNEMLATQMIDSLRESGDFVTLDKVMELANVKSEGELLDRLNRMNNFSILAMRNSGKGSSHITVLINGKSFDVNFRPKGENGPVELWVSVGDKDKFKNVLSNAVKYKTFNFKDEWIEEQIDKIYKSLDINIANELALYKYESYFGNYEYEILVPKYNFAFTMDLDYLRRLFNEY